MRLIFVGSGELGLPALKRLAPEICCVVTAPDKPAGRGLKTLPTPAKTLALSLGLTVIETGDVNSPAITARLTSCRPEIMLVAAFGQMLEKTVLELPEKGVFNIHPSLLPKYRGAAPVENAILNLERETGVTIIAVTKRMDAGPILAQRKIIMRPDEDTPALSQRLAEIGAELAADGLKQVTEGTAVLTPQDEKLATYTGKTAKEDGLIAWQKSAAEIAAQVRAFVRWPHAYTSFPFPAPGETSAAKNTLIIWKADPVAREIPAAVKPGTVLKVDRSGILVACGRDALLLTEMQAAGKKRLPAGEFIRGIRFTEGTVLG